MNNILNGIENSYRIYIENLVFNERVKIDFINLLNNNNGIERLNMWNTFQKSYPDFDFSILANPFYIGFGNPNSDILFVGKEKAFDISKNPGLFILESINNTLHWTSIYQNNQYELNHTRIFENLGFNPFFPKAYNTKKFRPRHTWGIYSTIVNGIQNTNLLLNESLDFQNSFFSNCFMTEINHVPSRYSRGMRMSQTRQNFFINDFYSGFTKIFIGAKGYLTLDEIKRLFNMDINNNGIDIELGQNNQRVITAKFFEDNNRKIVYCDQLSGAAGWTNGAINELIRIMN